jgi:hypothetical protein
MIIEQTAFSFCRRCNRLLTDRRSIAFGIGVECYKNEVAEKIKKIRDLCDEYVEREGEEWIV